jgi:hypothetical protein
MSGDFRTGETTAARADYLVERRGFEPMAIGPRRRPKRLSRPTDAAASRGNVVLFCRGGNHSGSRGGFEPMAIAVQNARVDGGVASRPQTAGARLWI